MHLKVSVLFTLLQKKPFIQDLVKLQLTHAQVNILTKSVALFASFTRSLIGSSKKHHSIDFKHFMYGFVR